MLHGGTQSKQGAADRIHLVVTVRHVLLVLLVFRQQFELDKGMNHHFFEAELKNFVEELFGDRSGTTFFRLVQRIFDRLPKLRGNKGTDRDQQGDKETGMDRDHSVSNILSTETRQSKGR